MKAPSDLTEKAAVLAALALAGGVLVWQVGPSVWPGSGTDDENSESAQLSGPRAADDEPLPWHPDLRRGQLDNGLSYYVLPHQKPEKRAYLWLVVRAGSLHEDEDQRGMAHFVEHMAFNGTAKYDKQAIIDYLESTGMRFGPEINAQTGFDSTIYKLKVPTDDGASVAKGLDFLHEWASAIAFDPKEIDAERGVVLEEWRASRGAQMRMAEKLIPAILPGSRYPDRIPIGTPESIKDTSREAILRYYQDWYRPELMAVLAVGDFDAESVEKQIAEVFGDLENPPSPRPRTLAEIPAHEEVLAAVITDDEADQPAVLVLDKIPHEPERTWGESRESLQALAGLLALNQRFGEIAQKPDAPFTLAAAAPDPTGMIEALDLIYTAGVPKNDRVADTTETLLMELVRAERHGFSDKEVDAVRKQLDAILGLAASRFGYQDGEEHIGQLVQSFTQGEVFVGPGAYEDMRAELGMLSAPDLQREMTEMMGDASRAVVIMAPAKIAVPSQDEVVAMAARLAKAELSPWGGSGETKPIMAELPKPGAITKTETDSELGLTIWTLENGARVIAKPTEFKDDQILVRASSPGGLSAVAESDVLTAMHAADIAVEAGLGELDPIELRDALAGKVAGLNLYLGDDAEFIDGETRPEDLEALLQMLHLHMSGVRSDDAAFERWQTRTQQNLDNLNALPEQQAVNKRQIELWRNHPRHRPPTSEAIAAVDYSRAKEIYRDRFVGNAGDFVFVFTGDIDVATLEPLVKTYLASLPSSERREKATDTGDRPLAGVRRLQTEAGREPKAQSATLFHGQAPWNLEAQADQDLVTEVVKLRLREVLREDEGGTYGVGVQGSWHDGTTGVHSIAIGFAADPDRVRDLHKLMLGEIDRVRAGTVNEADLDKVRETWRREHEEDMKSNEHWRAVLARAFRRGEDPRRALDIAARLARVSLDNLRAAAPVYLPRANRFDFFIDPDPKAGAPAPAPDRAPERPPAPARPEPAAPPPEASEDTPTTP